MISRMRLIFSINKHLPEPHDFLYVYVRRLAAKWCAEPSVHGGKKRPKGATLVI